METMYARAQAGDPDALACLIRKHIPLVQSLNRRFSFGEDTFQQGCLGLLLAIRRFDEKRGYRFSTYAVPVILGEMRRGLSPSLGWRARRTLHKAQEFEENFIRETGKSPSVQAAAQAAGTSPEELILLLESTKPPSMDQTGELLASLPDPQSDRWLIRFLIRDIFERMNKDDQQLLRMRYLKGKSQKETAEILGVTQSTLSRYEKKACLRFQKAWNE